ncbi:hypothetical protein QFZ70_001503 [Arthrobacter sp. V1I9]|uniref:hypothetical protein n=1 Tax=Arthrobacter sp. V1I9 TaxID=3042275 RepID=UPI0027915F83|nr:hypothetical protein [Arthrobacter sp. V1I9]MDQ0869030.1 hypothetical protein [Arthrobacter sp. V1I9]
MTPKGDVEKKKQPKQRASEVDKPAAGTIDKPKPERNHTLLALILTASVGITGSLANLGMAWIGQETTTVNIVCHEEVREAVKLRQETGVTLPYSGEVEEKCQINDKLKVLP